MFVGFDAFCGAYSSLPHYQLESKVEDLVLAEGSYRTTYVSEGTDESYINFVKDWDYNTRMKIDFANEKLDAGSSIFSVNNTDTMVIQIREKGSLDWITIYEIPIVNANSFNIDKKYYFARNNARYEFQVLSFLDGASNGYEMIVDGKYDTEEEMVSILSKFGGMVLCDKDVCYSTDLEVDPILYTRNINLAPLELLHNQYPSVVSYDDNNYKSGNLTALFLAKKDKCEFDFTPEENIKLRKAVTDWLTNKRPKVLKDTSGEIFIFQVSGKPTEVEYEDNFPDIKKLSFDFVETGSTDDEEDLYYNALIDVPANKY